MERFRKELVEELASKGNRNAIFEMERFYIYNMDIEDVPNEKLKLVVRYLLELAENNDKDAMVSLGSMYYEGKGGVQQNYKEAVKWYEKASIAYRLGKCYLHGEGVEQNFSLALEKLQSAEMIFFELIDEGDPFAVTTLEKVKKEIDTGRNRLYELHGIE